MRPSPIKFPCWLVKMCLAHSLRSVDVIMRCTQPGVDGNICEWSSLEDVAPRLIGLPGTGCSPPGTYYKADNKRSLHLCMCLERWQRFGWRRFPELLTARPASFVRDSLGCPHVSNSTGSWSLLPEGGTKVIHCSSQAFNNNFSWANIWDNIWDNIVSVLFWGLTYIRHV